VSYNSNINVITGKEKMQDELNLEPPVVWVVDNSTRKTIKDAARFGEIMHVFTDTAFDDPVQHAREVLKDYRDGDYICLIGDPKLSAIAVGVVAQNNPGCEIKLLQFDSRTFMYQPFYLNF
jgi:hypothetical protein